jgi:transketolase N-terminal domain/subunit
VSGVETTTGPLGQGIATSVGFAIAQKWLAQRYNRPGFDIFDYHIYAVCGDGCMMEGVGQEAGRDVLRESDSRVSLPLDRSVPPIEASIRSSRPR